MILSRDQILQADDLKREKVPVPEWGGEVYVRMMTGSERDLFEARYAETGRQDIRAAAAMLTICDENGKSLFTPADILALSKKSAAALDRCAEAALRLAKVSEKDIEDLQGKSNASHSDASSSGSPENGDAASANS